MEIHDEAMQILQKGNAAQLAKVAQAGDPRPHKDTMWGRYHSNSTSLLHPLLTPRAARHTRLNDPDCDSSHASHHPKTALSRTRHEDESAKATTHRQCRLEHTETGSAHTYYTPYYPPMSADAIMLDSPASTPDPKTQQSNAVNAAGLPLASEGAMDIDSHANGASAPAAPTTAGSWDTKKWRDDVLLTRAKLLHQHYLSSKNRDPLDKPLVTRPPGLSTEAEQRLRKHYLESVA